LIEIGVEILNPVQVSADNMDTQDLKKRYGKKLSFWGAIDTFDVLPNGRVSDVQTEVNKRIHDLGTGGGYVMAPVHNVCCDVPPENIVAMYEAGPKYSASNA
jgi:uroporphyrinogen decarboxylase